MIFNLLKMIFDLTLLIYEHVGYITILYSKMVNIYQEDSNIVLTFETNNIESDNYIFN